MFVINSYVFGDPDLRSILDRAVVVPSTPQINRMKGLISELKAAGVWQILDTLLVPIRGETEQVRLLDWKRPLSAILTGANASTNSTYGFEVGASSYIDTDYNPALGAVNVSQNSHTAFAWVTKLPDFTGGNLWHPLYQRAGLTLGLRAFDSDYRLDARINNASIVAAAVDGACEVGELFATGRDGSTSSAIYKTDSVVKTSATASAAWATPTSAYNVRILDLGSSTDVSGGVGVFGMGAFLDTTKLAALKTAIQNYLA